MAYGSESARIEEGYKNPSKNSVTVEKYVCKTCQKENADLTCGDPRYGTKAFSKMPQHKCWELKKYGSKKSA